MTQDFNNQLSPTPNMTTAKLVENDASSPEFGTISGESIFVTVNRQEWIFDDDSIPAYNKLNLVI